MIPDTEFVTLEPGPTGGLIVPLDAYNLALELERRDLTLRQVGDSLRIQGPHGTKPDLSAGDVDRIRRYKFHLFALMHYRGPDISQ